MSRYIDADELLKRLPNDLPYKASVKRVLIQAPTADVAEVRHGRWVWDANIKRCSWCRAECPADEYNYMHPQYCCTCGAKMDGGTMTMELKPNLIKTGLVNFSKNTEVKIYYPGGDNLIGDALALIEHLSNEITDWKEIAEQYQRQFEDARADTARTIQNKLREVAFVDATFMGKPNVVLMDDVDRIVADILEGEQ